MRKRIVALVSAAVWLMAAGTASAAVNVTFIAPENFTDLSRSAVDREHLLHNLQTYFAKLGTRLPADRNLTVEVLDIDLAGRMEPYRYLADEIRVVRGRADWPRMQLRYSLASNGKVISQGEEWIADMSYRDSVHRHDSGDTLQYEKRMLDDWFTTKFLSQQEPK
jgi:uncharacterized lipoprotein YbaY